MALDRITLARFRNHADTAIDDTRGFNLLVGENGAGKTNVLEAISLLSPGRGLRRAALAEMTASGAQGGFVVGATLVSPDHKEAVRLGTQVDPARPGRRQVRVNGADASAVSLGEWLAVGWLVPAMDRIFMDGASARRRFLDRLALAFDPGHASHLSRFERALRERNRLLAGDRPPDPVWLDGIEAQLAEHGTRLAAGRFATIARLNRALAELPQAPFARPALDYAAGGPVSPAELRDALRSGRARDRAAGRTLTGPHRDDLAVRMAGKDMPAANCSTGEQKAMLIAIVLAHAELAAHGRPNLLLLDEVAAHLDPLRRSALFERLRSSGAQVWLTGTELAPFAEIRGEAAVWQVENGGTRRV